MPAINALCFATIMYRSRLVPRWIPTVGLIGARCCWRRRPPRCSAPGSRCRPSRCSWPCPSLDIGCGWGECALPLAEIASHVDAVGLRQEAIDAFRLFAKEQEVDNVSVACSGFLDWSRVQPSGRYDFAFCGNTLTRLSPTQRRAGLMETRRLVRDDGVFLVDFHTSRGYLYRAFVRQVAIRHRAEALGTLARGRLTRSHLTARKFEAEARDGRFRISWRLDWRDGHDPRRLAYEACRTLEGSCMGTIAGRYFCCYVLAAAKPQD